jgi:hypothetical protein
MLNALRRLASNKQFREGAVIHQEEFKLPFRQDLNLLANMFELRKWYVFNTPYKYYAEKYTNEMAHLHNEINYLAARELLKRTVLVFGLLYSYFWFVSEPDAIDWRDSFDIKISEKTYGTMTSSAGEGNESLDE